MPFTIPRSRCRVLARVQRASARTPYVCLHTSGGRRLLVSGLHTPSIGLAVRQQSPQAFPSPTRKSPPPSRTPAVLPGLELTIPAGQTVALVGATGAGKTTVARLLARFYDPGAGRILLDGVDLRALADQTLRREVVLVTQENFLFSGSIAYNMRLGKPDASQAEIEAAAAAIGADAFIRAMPGGFDAPVGKRGSRLSAGQRQLISFARAFLAAPAVLVLDEATALLDIPGERVVQAALRTILAERTALIIAQRLSTVEIADRVIVLSAGGIVEDGPPRRLLAAGGEYSALHADWQGGRGRGGGPAAAPAGGGRRVFGPARGLAGEPGLT